ncbi:MAG: ribonuclease Y [Eubacteriales bacterium]|nr:ribonuclease Y [Eubacteriales bacterium]
MVQISITIAIAVVIVLVVIFISFNIGKKSERNNYANKVGTAEKRSKEIVNDALKMAESIKTEKLLEAKESILKQKSDLERELTNRRREVKEIEERALKRDELSEKKSLNIDQKENALLMKEEDLKLREERVKNLYDERVRELERISTLSREAAKIELFSAVREEIKHDIAKYIKEEEAQAKEEVEKNSIDLMMQVIQRCCSDHVSEATVSVVELPNEEMKGRIIGREGRNIRALENLTGVEFVIDDTPDTVVLSSFDPIRREIARVALEKLILDGRIHPARIEEIVEKSKKEVDQSIKEYGEEAVLSLGIHGINPELVKYVGRLHYRFSYGQNALVHSMEVAQLSGIFAQELGLNVQLAKRAGLLHDIGKSIDHEKEGTHVTLGAELCRKYKEPLEVINSVESHHGDKEALYPIAFIVGASDAISAARPGARRETIENYTQRLIQLEEITNAYEGVEKSFAVQAGREVRIMVTPEKVSEDDMIIMARAIAKQIEEQMTYPGTIKVNVIRESRAIDFAK